MKVKSLIGKDPHFLSPRGLFVLTQGKKRRELKHQ